MTEMFPGVDLRIKRPVIRYHGGKWNIAPWIISHFPKHRVYVEPYGGGASVLLRKKRSTVEIYNDLDGEIVDFFRLLRDKDKRDQLCEMVRLTSYSRREFEEAFEPATDDVDRMRRLLVRAYFGFGSHSHNADNSNGFRSSSNKPYGKEWLGISESLCFAGDRLQGVTFENRPALDLIHSHDGPKTLFFLDPPYPEQSRNNHGKGYKFEMSDGEHHMLAAHLDRCIGKVILCGYPNSLYERLYPKWHREECKAYAASGQQGRVERTEVLWMNF